MNKRQKAKRDKIVKMIDEFLAVRNKSNGGWAPVGENDVKQLHNILEALRDVKYERDPDGDLPIQFAVVDRTKYESMHYVLVPHSYGTETAEEMYDALSAAQLNASMASERLDQLFRVWNSYRADEKRKQ